MEKHRQKGAERMTEKMEGRNPLVQLSSWNTQKAYLIILYPDHNTQVEMPIWAGLGAFTTYHYFHS
jgi:hypothetical protein